MKYKIMDEGGFIKNCRRALLNIMQIQKKEEEASMTVRACKQIYEDLEVEKKMGISFSEFFDKYVVIK